MLRHLLLVAVAAPLLALALAHRRPGWGHVRCPGLPATGGLGPRVPGGLGLARPALHHATRAGFVSLLLEQCLFLGSGLCCGSTALARPQAGIVALLLTAGHMTLLGVLLALSPRPLFGAAPIGHDQELGGVLMLAIGGAAYLAGGLMLLARLLKPSPAAGR